MTGTAKELYSLKEKFENSLAKDYNYRNFENENYKGQKMFIFPNGPVVHIDVIESYKCLVIEFAESIQDAENLMLEDGDLYYPEDYQEEEKMFQDMLNEITG